MHHLLDKLKDSKVVWKEPSSFRKLVTAKALKDYAPSLNCGSESYRYTFADMAALIFFTETIIPNARDMEYNEVADALGKFLDKTDDLDNSVKYADYVVRRVDLKEYYESLVKAYATIGDEMLKFSDALYYMYGTVLPITDEPLSLWETHALTQSGFYNHYRDIPNPIKEKYISPHVIKGWSKKIEESDAIRKKLHERITRLGKKLGMERFEINQDLYFAMAGEMIDIFGETKNRYPSIHKDKDFLELSLGAYFITGKYIRGYPAGRSYSSKFCKNVLAKSVYDSFEQLKHTIEELKVGPNHVEYHSILGEEESNLMLHECSKMPGVVYADNFFSFMSHGSNIYTKLVVYDLKKLRKIGTAECTLDQLYHKVREIHKSA